MVELPHSSSETPDTRQCCGGTSDLSKACTSRLKGKVLRICSRGADALDCIPTGVLLLREGKIVHANPALQDLLGYSADEMLARGSVSDFIHESDREETLRRIQSNTEGKFRVTSVKKDGSLVRMEIVVKISMYEGKPTRVVSFVDITEIERNIRLLSDANEKLKALIENTPTGTYMVRSDGTLDLTNAACEAITGYSRQELSTMHFLDIIHPDDRGRVKARGIARLRGESVEMGYEARIECKDKSIKYVRLFPSLVMISGEKCLMGEILDITKDRAHENALIMSSSMLSHEISNILASLTGRIEMMNTRLADLIEEKAGLMLEHDDGEGLIRERLAEIQEEFKLLSQIKDELHDISEATLRMGNIETNGAEPERDIIDLGEYLRGRRILHGERAARKNVELKIDISEIPSASIYEDRQLFGVVINNLIGNAIKFTKHGSEVNVKLTIEDDVIADVCYIKIAITDQGIGIDEEGQKRLFLPFSQAHENVAAIKGKTKDTYTKGHGMGLHVSRRISEMLGGELYLENSEVGVGSTFTLKLPIAPFIRKPVRTGQNEDTRPMESVENMRPMRTLIVEDESHAKILARRMFERSGCMVDVVTTAEEAIALMRTYKYDIIYVDLCLRGDGMSGIDLVEMIRARDDGAWKTAPTAQIIANSASVDLGPQVLEAGADHFLSKPISGVALSSIISNIRRDILEN